MSENWHPALAETEFPEDGKATVVLNGWHILIGRTDTGFHAINDRCTHAASFLSTGRIRRGAVMCPLHGARFELNSGRCVGGAYRNLRVFPLRVVDGVIEIEVPEAQPGNEELPIAL